jgi:hypothetical protein
VKHQEKLLRKQNQYLIKRGYIFYDNKRLGRVPIEVVEEILGLHIKLGA